MQDQMETYFWLSGTRDALSESVKANPAESPRSEPPDSPGTQRRRGLQLKWQRLAFKLYSEQTGGLDSAMFFSAICVRYTVWLPGTY